MSHWKRIYASTGTNKVSSAIITSETHERALELQELLQENDTGNWEGEYLLELPPTHADSDKDLYLSVKAGGLEIISFTHTGRAGIQLTSPLKEDGTAKFERMLLRYLYSPASTLSMEDLNDLCPREDIDILFKELQEYAEENEIRI